jgi:hypothetical protein
MAVYTSAIIAIGTGIATAVSAHNESTAASVARQKADDEAKRLMAQAKKRAEVDEYGELEIPLDAYEAELDANIAADRQAIEALQEGDARALAAGVGRIGAQQATEAQQTRRDLADEMYSMDKMKADAEMQKQQQLMAMDIGEAKMADQRAREEAERKALAQKNMMAGISQTIQGVASMAPLYGVSQDDKRAQKVMANDKMKERAKLSGIDINDKQAYYEWISTQDISNEQYRQIMKDSRRPGGYDIEW